MESIAVVDDTGQTEIGQYNILCFILFILSLFLSSGSIRHIIKSIREGGPMDTSSDLRIGDEILQVDGQVLVGLTHERATEVVREATNQVKLIVCRTISAPSSAHSAARLGQNDDNESEQGKVYMCTCITCISHVSPSLSVSSFTHSSHLLISSSSY